MTGPFTAAAFAVVLGGGLGLGLWCLLTLSPRWSAPGLADRVAPYVRDVADPRGITPLGRPAGGGMLSWRTAAEALAARMGRAVGGSEVIARRLAQAGDARGVESFRGRQLWWTVAGLALGSIAVIALALAGRMSPALVVVPPIAALAAAALCDLRLQSRARARASRLHDQLPAVLEFLSLCLAAGEGLRDALRRVAGVSSGELTDELRTVVLDVGTGSSLAEALRELDERAQLPALSRAVDQLVGAMERGAPLAHVLQAQAHDAREEARRSLIERAGRAEIAMLVPLVFLILPLSVLFAVYPGVVLLRLGLG
ncbi:type II secretion system F family protein [Microbacterium sp. HA-8]|uniref:type II secretion system F family protein n=1 Tax=Microbacterium sp. HA-8 TaxID=3234200 RepID=UPI0038F6D246